ncbi:lysophospholipid acyltransferase family protein [Rhodovulum sp. FJ3]|uniref:lysophospholipid acyltransferase family protein n=1 Tax=Rhodovulum sp. FJ3 TaxID=3079053 RepID=UPI0039797E4A
MRDVLAKTADNAPIDQTEVEPYDKRRLSYANTFENPVQATIIRTMEWLTGKITLLRLIREYERGERTLGQAFWGRALELLDIPLTTPDEQIAQIPKTGPVVIVANHPHGLVDGMVLAELVGRVRTDYKILTRAILTGADEVDPFVIPVPFPHEADARERNLEMRKRAMSHLKGGGVVVIFPSGAVANSETFFGPAEEAEWNPFTAKMIQRSGAVVVPVRFPGQNSRAYLIANKLSATLRQGLLIHEVVHARHKPQAPIVGPVIGRDEIESWSTNSRGFMAWLREKTLSL